MKMYFFNIIMSISIEHLPKLSNIELKFKQNKYAICPEATPKLYFLLLALGSRGSGKTYKICELIKMYENFGLYLKGKKVDIRTILVSPTYHANPVYTSLKSLDKSDIYEHYSDDILDSILNDIKQEKLNTDEYKIKKKIWNKFLKVKHIDELDHHELIELEMMGYHPPKPPKYPNSVVNFCLFDDCVGSSMLKSCGPSKFTKFCIANRHVNCNVIIMAQGIKNIPRVIRSNTSVFVIFKFASAKVITDDLWTEISNTTSLEDFEKLFEFATRNDHDALVIDLTQPKPDRFKRNFDSILKISS